VPRSSWHKWLGAFVGGIADDIDAAKVLAKSE
jgi:hypothetical protein